MSMNITDKENTISTEEFMRLSEKEPQNLDPKEVTQINMYQRFTELSEALEKNGHLPTSAESIIAEHNQKMGELATKPLEQQTKTQKEELEKWQNRFKPTPEEHSLTEDGPTRKLTQKAGYINASILLYAILNIGFIVAVTMLYR